MKGHEMPKELPGTNQREVALSVESRIVKERKD